MNLIRTLIALAVVLLLSSDAFAFGKNGKGVFGWRGQASCTGCAPGQCATGSCSTTCSSGQCATSSGVTESKITQTTFIKDGKQYVQYCDGTKCWIVSATEAVRVLTSEGVKSLTKIEGKDGNVWATDGNVWKVK